MMRIGELRLRLRRNRRREQALMLALMAEEEEQARDQRRRRTMWVRPWIQRRPLLGQYDTLMQELIRESRGDFKGYLRMDPEMFHELLVRVSPRVTKSEESRPPLAPGLKIAITLRFLATGNSYHSLAFDFPTTPYRCLSLRYVLY